MKENMNVEHLNLQQQKDCPQVVSGIEGVRSLMFAPHLISGPDDIQNAAFLQRELKIPMLIRAVGVPFERDPKQEMLVTDKVVESFSEVGGLLLDLFRMKPNIVMPASGDELQNFVKNVLIASVTRKPVQFYTPCCPDWSQDKDGRYDYQALNGGPSFIAEKSLREAPGVLSAFQAHKIPYEGNLVIADWGLENEIEAFDHDGRRLSQDEVIERFHSTASHAEDSVRELQGSQDKGSLFAPYKVILMSDLFKERGIDPNETYSEARLLFLERGKGQKLVRELHTASLGINTARRGLSEEQNYNQAVQSLSEYATFSSALPVNSVIFAAESQITSKGYNTFREVKTPVIFLKGESRFAQAVNIL